MLSFSTLSSLAMPTSGSATPTSSLQRRNSLKSELLFLDSPQPTSELGTRIKAELSKKRSLQNLRRGNSVKSDNTFLRTTPSPSLQRGSSLKADMKAMLDDDKYFDVVFVCADGAEVRGSRAILSARSDTLDHLLLRSTGKRDSAPAKIHLPEITSRSFRVVLRYIYTETIPPLSHSELLSVYRAGALLTLPRLQTRLLKRILRTVENPDAAVPLLTEAVATITPNSDTRQLFDVLFNVFCARPLSIGDLADLSPTALEHLLLGTKTKPFLTSEYDLLICVVDWAWSLTQGPPPRLDRRRSFDVILDGTRSASSKRDSNPHSHLPPAMPLEEVKQLLSRVTIHIDLTLICPHRLAHFVDRMDVVTHDSLLLAFRHHACRQASCALGHTLGLRGTFFCWESEPSPSLSPAGADTLRVSEDGTVAENWSDPRDGGRVHTVRGAHAISYPGTYEWDIIIETNGVADAQEPDRYRWNEVGLAGAEEIVADVPISEQAGCWGFRTFGAAAQVVTGGGEDDLYGVVFGQGDVVRVSLDMKERTCSFSVNGMRFPVAWADLPDRVWPAVTLAPFARYRIRPVVCKA